MSKDTFTEESHSGTLNNIGGSIMGAIIGILLLLGGLAALFWNEGNYVKTSKALDEAQGQVINVGDITSVNSANEAKIVHMSGDATTEETLNDAMFELEHQGLSLIRKVQYYQWEEHQESKEEKELGGGTKKVTTYSYKRIWTNEPIDSSSFKQSQYQNNIALENCNDVQIFPKKVKFGAFTLNAGQINRIQTAKDLALTNYSLPEHLADTAEVQGNTIYINSPKVDDSQKGNPQIGDMKISWQAAPARESISIIAQQQGQSFCAYVASSGKEVDLLGLGVQTQEQLFNTAHSDNSTQLWIIRIIGILVVCIACSLVAGPLEAITNIIPFLGDIVGFVSRFVAFLIGIILSLLVISAAWIFYRPLIGLGCLAVVAGILYLMKKMRQKTANAET